MFAIMLKHFFLNLFICCVMISLELSKKPRSLAVEINERAINFQVSEIIWFSKYNYFSFTSIQPDSTVSNDLIIANFRCQQNEEGRLFTMILYSC